MEVHPEAAGKYGVPNTAEAWVNSGNLGSNDGLLPAAAQPSGQAGSSAVQPLGIAEGKEPAEGSSGTPVVGEGDIQGLEAAAQLRLSKISTSKLLLKMRSYIFLSGDVNVGQLDAWDTFVSVFKHQAKEMAILPLVLLPCLLWTISLRVQVDMYYEDLERIGWNTTSKAANPGVLGFGKPEQSAAILWMWQLGYAVSIACMCTVTALIPLYMLTRKWMSKCHTALFSTYPLYQIVIIGIIPVVVTLDGNITLNNNVYFLLIYIMIPIGWWFISIGYSKFLGFRFTKYALAYAFDLIITFGIYGSTLPPAYFAGSFAVQAGVRLIGHPLIVGMGTSVARVICLLMPLKDHHNALVFIPFNLYWWTSVWGRYLVANAPTIWDTVWLNLGLTLTEMVARAYGGSLDTKLLSCVVGKVKANRIMTSPRAVRLHTDLSSLDTFDEMFGIIMAAFLVGMFQISDTPGETISFVTIVSQTGIAFGIELVGILAMPYMTGVVLGGGYCGERHAARRRHRKQFQEDLKMARSGDLEAATPQPGDERYPSPGLVSQSSGGAGMLRAPTLQRLRNHVKVIPRAPMNNATAEFDHMPSFVTQQDEEGTANVSYVGTHRITNALVIMPTVDAMEDEEQLRKKMLFFLSQVRPMGFWEAKQRYFTNVLNAEDNRPKHYYWAIAIIIFFSMDLWSRNYFTPMLTTCVRPLNDQTLWYATYQTFICGDL